MKFIFHDLVSQCGLPLGIRPKDKDADFTFFRFLSLREMKVHQCFSLWSLLEQSFDLTKEDEAKEKVEKGWPFMLRVQAACFADLVEKLRLGSGVTLASRHMPPWMKLGSTNLDAKQWLRVTNVNVTLTFFFLKIPWVGYLQIPAWLLVIESFFPPGCRSHLLLRRLAPSPWTTTRTKLAFAPPSCLIASASLQLSA